MLASSASPMTLSPRTMRASIACVTTPLNAQTNPGRLGIASRRASCHGTTGDGGELGPSIVRRAPARTHAELTGGPSSRGCHVVCRRSELCSYA